MDVGMKTRRIPRIAIVLLLAGLAFSACSRPQPKQYPLHGQVLAVDTDRQRLTIRHDDIPGLMEGMTMSFQVATPDLLEGREPGEVVDATLEVSDALGRLTSIRRVGFEPLDESASAGRVLKIGDAVPDAAFVDQAGARRSLAEWRGTPTLFTFTSSRCAPPNSCPLADGTLSKIQAAVAADAGLRGRVRLVTVSIDPAYDTPDVLAAEAARLKADPAVWTFLTGDRPTVDRFAAAMGVQVHPTADDAPTAHDPCTVLVGADGRITAIYAGRDWTVEGVLEALRAAVAPHLT
jgi:protein SCO1/2